MGALDEFLGVLHDCRNIVARVDWRRPVEVTDQVRPEATVRRFCPFLWLTGGEGRNNQYLKVLVVSASMGLCFGRHGWGVQGWLARPTVGIVQAPQAASLVLEM